MAKQEKRSSKIEKQDPHISTNRRDFITTTAIVAGTVGAACAAWPFIQSMGPAADTEALSTVDVDIGNIQPGQGTTVLWRGKPVFIRRRTQEEITTAQNVSLTQLIDPESDQTRVPQNPEWLVVVGVCTHLGCVPQGQKATEPKGAYGGWFCPCHGSEYDLSGRVRKGPAPKNLPVPDYRFLDEKTIRIGEKNV